ncbi:MAG: hypothetical protein NXH75_18015 [Halobacteriovoraceae bacterium]|nr:hypothetical protein [Halobacteriovoraceae bacterium]
MGLKDDNHKISKEAKETQKFASRLMSLLSGKTGMFKSESHWELIFAFIFFFGGIYFIFNMIN